MRIGIMGGTFDPVHSGHLEIARAVRDAMALDGVMLLPAGDPPHKRRKAGKRDRMEMTRLAAAEAGFEACAEEIEREGTTYTVDTLTAFHRQRPEVEWVYIIGADTLKVLDSWRNFPQIAKLCEFAAVGRPGIGEAAVQARIEEISSKYGAKISRVDAVGPEISSTLVRERAARGESIADLVPPPVENYIREKGLYLAGMTENDLLEKLQGQIKPSRYEHTLGVAATAERLAPKFGIDPNRARIAALLHDCAKSMSHEEMQDIVSKAGVDADETEMGNYFVLHAPAGAARAMLEYGVQDAAILSAIRWHTIGGAQMSALDALIYTADCIEPGRKPYPGIEELRALAEEDIFAAARLCAGQSIEYVKSRGGEPHPVTLEMLK